MNTYTSVWTELMAFLFGRKYYVNIVSTKGKCDAQMSSFIFRTKADANEHRIELENNASFRFEETVSFRSRNLPQELTWYYITTTDNTRKKIYTPFRK